MKQTVPQKFRDLNKAHLLVARGYLKESGIVIPWLHYNVLLNIGAGEERL